MEKEKMEEEELLSDKDTNQAESDQITENLKSEEANNSENSEVSEDSEDSKIKVLQDELSEMKDKYLRLYSEFDNYRKRVAKEKLNLIESASEELLTQLLPVLDDFDRAARNNNEKTEAKILKEGFDLIHNKFEKIVKSKGLKEMELKEGSNFDVEFHEAISQIPVEKKKLKGKIIDVVEKGYTLNDKVVRFAKVVIGN